MKILDTKTETETAYLSVTRELFPLHKTHFSCMKTPSAFGF